MAHTTGEPGVLSCGQDARHERHQEARLLGDGCHLVVTDILLGLPGTHCYHETTSTNVNGYVTNNTLLTIQFVILLALFVKPMLGRQVGTQSGGAVYRRVVHRNVVCTTTIVVATVITTVVTALAMIRNSPEDNKVHGGGDDTTSDSATPCILSRHLLLLPQPRQVADVIPAVNSFVTLCLTEIALPLGFTSAWKSIFGEHPAQRHQPPGGGGAVIMSKADVAPGRSSATKTNGVVVPVEAQP
ncbi:unnamed protein product [Ectocarpus sp. 8 AP-2014]